MVKELLITQLGLNLCLIPLITILYVLNYPSLLEHLLQVLISISISICIIKIEFDGYIKEFHRFNQYILAMLFSLITFLMIELLIEKNNYVFCILIILIVLCGYVISRIFVFDNSPRND